MFICFNGDSGALHGHQVLSKLNAQALAAFFALAAQQEQRAARKPRFKLLNGTSFHSPGDALRGRSFPFRNRMSAPCSGPNC